MHKSMIVGASVICASIAFAAQQQSGQPLRGPSGGVQDPQPPGQPMGSLAGGGCTDGPPLNWFTVVHAMPDCEISTSGNPDVNGDGVLEYFTHIYGPVVVGGVPVDGVCLQFLQTLTQDSGGTAVTLQCVLMSDVVGHFMVGAPYFATEVERQASDYRDMDLDGDLDLLLSVYWVSSTGGGEFSTLWVENTGYEHNPPLAADINGDGAVGATDLSMLLAAWTGQQ